MPPIHSIVKRGRAYHLAAPDLRPSSREGATVHALSLFTRQGRPGERLQTSRISPRIAGSPRPAAFAFAPPGSGARAQDIVSRQGHRTPVRPRGTVAGCNCTCGKRVPVPDELSPPYRRARRDDGAGALSIVVNAATAHATANYFYVHDMVRAGLMALDGARGSPRREHRPHDRGRARRGPGRRPAADDRLVSPALGKGGARRCMRASPPPSTRLAA